LWYFERIIFCYGDFIGEIFVLYTICHSPSPGCNVSRAALSDAFAAVSKSNGNILQDIIFFGIKNYLSDSRL
jgi:hypothetical protein